MSHMQGKPPGAAPGPPLPTRGERKKWENTKSLPNSGKLCGQHHSLALPPCSPLPTNVLERRNASGEAAPGSRAMGIVRERFPLRASAGIGGNAGSAHLPGMILRKFKLGIISLPPELRGKDGHAEFQGLQLLTLLPAHQHSQFGLFSASHPTAYLRSFPLLIFHD